MKRRHVVVGLVAVTVAAAATALLWPRGPRPCRATFDQVRDGMTFAEVCATVGRPPGIYTRQPFRPMFLGVRDCREHWAADDGELLVWFDDDRRVYQVEVFDPIPDGRPWTERLWDWLPL